LYDVFGFYRGEFGEIFDFDVGFFGFGGEVEGGGPV